MDNLKKMVSETINNISNDCCKVCACDFGIKLWCSCHRKQLLESLTKVQREACKRGKMEGEVETGLRAFPVTLDVQRDTARECAEIAQAVDKDNYSLTAKTIANAIKQKYGLGGDNGMV